MAQRPLDGIRVLDLSIGPVGGVATMVLGDFGADVIKVEPPGGDPGRLHGPFAGNAAGPEGSLPFLYRNANKRGVAIDLHDPDGADRFEALCARADVLLENYGLNRRQVLDLAPEAVRERHPHLVNVALSDFAISSAISARIGLR